MADRCLSPIMPYSYRQVLSREHERARRRILQVRRSSSTNFPCGIAFAVR